ncbi:MAG: [FeFe] hydrogenase H-cluster radical SAM maturase HydE, partial [Halothermotrichaceae bacterium]
MNKIKQIIDRAFSTQKLNKDEIVALLAVEDNTEELQYLYKKADQLRNKYHGNKVHLRAIIEFSNYCCQNCKYCGLRKDNKKVKRYQLTPEEIIDTAVQSAKIGYKTIVLQSGEDYYDAGKISRVITSIKEKADTAVTLCLGERGFEEYKLWRKAGADRYLLKHETAAENFYHELHPGMSYQERIKRLKWLKDLGYQVGSGNIVGLPGQTLEILAQDIMLFKKMNFDMIGIGPFISHPETPLGKKYNKDNPVDISMSLKVLAVTRLLLPLTHLPATTALGTLDSQGRQKGLHAGANVVMPNVTDTKYREHYQIYPEKICINEKASDCRQCIG